MQKTKCQECNRKAKYSYSNMGKSTAPENQIYLCGYHTWWSGCRMDKESRDKLNEEYKIN